MTTQTEALKLALNALNDMACWQEGREVDMGFDEPYAADISRKAITAIKEALAQPEQDNTYIYASSLATAIWQKHYMKESPKFALLDTTEGVLTQIDNMTCGLVREKPAQPEQEHVAWISHAITSAEKAIDVAIKLEREACANICEEKYYLAVADAIRARGQE